MTNLYYSPEDFGYEIIGELAEDLDYAFNMLVVWRRLSDGALFYSTDSGCSCPGWFEDHVEADLVPIRQNPREFEDALRGFPVPGVEKQRFWLLARKPFGANVVVTGSEVFLT